MPKNRRGSNNPPGGSIMATSFMSDRVKTVHWNELDLNQKLLPFRIWSMSVPLLQRVHESKTTMMCSKALFIGLLQNLPWNFVTARMGKMPSNQKISSV